MAWTALLAGRVTAETGIHWKHRRFPGIDFGLIER
jgi:hypothetical protein